MNIKEPTKIKRKRIADKLLTGNDGVNTPVPDSLTRVKLIDNEAALYKQANNPLGDPNKR